MYKFLFNLQNHTLKIAKGDYFLVIPEEHQFAYFSSIGFNLNSNQPEHQIIFSIYKEKIQVLYKLPQPDGSVVRYKRELPRPASGIVEVEFSEWDRIKKPKSEQGSGSFNKESE